jgi:hypothetical protein
MSSLPLSVNGALQRRHSVASSAFASPQPGQLIAMVNVLWVRRAELRRRVYGAACRGVNRKVVEGLNPIASRRVKYTQGRFAACPSVG